MPPPSPSAPSTPPKPKLAHWVPCWSTRFTYWPPTIPCQLSSLSICLFLPATQPSSSANCFFFPWIPLLVAAPMATDLALIYNPQLLVSVVCLFPCVTQHPVTRWLHPWPWPSSMPQLHHQPPSAIDQACCPLCPHLPTIGPIAPVALC